MIDFSGCGLTGFEEAIRGARNPMNSWDKTDSKWDFDTSKHQSDYPWFDIGPNDMKLLKKLRDAGTPDHRKFLRMLIVWVDITAPLYWWKEFDTYKVGTVANSCSTMHKIHAKEFTPEDFSCEHLFDDVWECQDGTDSYYASHMTDTIRVLNNARLAYLETKDKKYWWQMIQLLPSSYNQKRTVMLNYEVLVNIYRARKNHKLDEWHDFCHWIEGLPYAKELIIGEE